MAGVKYPSNRLKQLRQARKISLRALAEKTGVDCSTIHFCEKGQRNFSANSLKALADYFEVSTDYLLGKSPEEMLDDFADSLQRDFLVENMHSDGEVTQSLSASITEPTKTKIKAILLLQKTDDLPLLSSAYKFLRYACPGGEFADVPYLQEVRAARMQKFEDLISILVDLNNDSLDVLLETAVIRKQKDGGGE